jgi:hypothetical protein
MALAVCQALRDERISNVAMLPSYDFEQVLGRPYKIQHTVYEIRNRSSQYFGAKTGFLYETRFHTAAGLVSPQGKKLCVALLSGQTRAESEELLPAIGEWADQMYSWAGQSVL